MKKLFITEKQEKILAECLNKEIYQMPVDKKNNKPYSINPEKVLIVKKFLDKGFTPHDFEKIGENGLPIKIKVISMNASNGEVLKYMYQDQLQDLLIDRFQNMFSDKIERELFMGQVIKDWLNKKIGIFGNLSTNRLLAESMTSEEIDERANKANTNPTYAQKKAGNYSMGHIIVQGMPISIENPKGSKRYWKDEEGNEGYNVMKNHYGYFKKTSGNGRDGDAIDVFIGPDPEATTVYVVDQKINDKFDESKVMLGFKSITDAKKAYMSNYSKDWKGFMDITGVDIDVFKKWLYDGRKQRKAFSEYKGIKLNENKYTKINESEIKHIVNESFKKVLLEDKEQTRLTNILIKKLYKVAQNYKQIYKDNDWRYLKALMADLSNVPGVRDFNYGGGKYHQNGKEFGESAYKLYTVEIETEFDTIIRGEVYCNFAGTIADPWSRYDMTVNFWRDSEINDLK